MIAHFFANVAEAFTSPRSSARALLTRAPDMQHAALMTVLAFALHVVAGNLVSLFLDGGFPDANPVMRVMNLALQFLQFFVLTFGAFAVCKKFGGKASRVQIAAVTAWHSVVNAFLSPAQLVALRSVATPEASGLLLLLPITLGISVWIYSSFLAEANGFKKLGPVVIGVILGFVVLGALLQVLLGLFISPEQLAASGI